MSLISVEYADGKNFEVRLQVIGEFVEKVKKMIVQDLKKNAEFKDAEIFASDIFLYYDKAKSKEITELRMPNGSNFYAKLEFHGEQIVFDNPIGKLCQGLSSTCKYQFSKELEHDLKEQVLSHFKYWKAKKFDKTLQPLYICYGDPGSGKSRFLDEFRNILLHTIPSNDECHEYVQKAFVFPISFENGTHTLIGDPAYEIGGRMMYQLQREKSNWISFASSEHSKITIGSVLRILPQQYKSVIILVDGMQELEHVPGSKSSTCYKVLQSIVEIICACKERLVIIVCASSVLSPFNDFFSSATHLKCYIPLKLSNRQRKRTHRS